MCGTIRIGIKGGGEMDLMKLKQLREVKGLTQTDLAKLVGVTMNSIARWEQGSNAPSEENLVKLKEVLNIKEEV